MALTQVALCAMLEGMKKLCARIAGNELFQRFILFLIVLTAAGMGFEAVPELAEMHGGLFYALDVATQAVFVFEIAVRIGAHAPSFGKFFRERWNVFDFTVVALSLVPAVGSFALVARLLRVLRALRVLSAPDRLREFMDRLSGAFDEVLMAAGVVLVAGYVFVISGHYLFADIDPARWGDLRAALMSVFYLLLLQDVPSYVDPLAARSLCSLLFFAAFYIVFLGLAVSVVAAAGPRGKTK